MQTRPCARPCASSGFQSRGKTPKKRGGRAGGPAGGLQDLLLLVRPRLPSEISYFVCIFIQNTLRRHHAPLRHSCAVWCFLKKTLLLPSEISFLHFLIKKNTLRRQHAPLRHSCAVRCFLKNLAPATMRPCALRAPYGDFGHLAPTTMRPLRYSCARSVS